MSLEDRGALPSRRYLQVRLWTRFRRPGGPSGGLGPKTAPAHRLGIVPRMKMRAWLSSSRSGRAACLTLLVLFALICGIHFAGAHHDGDGDDLGLVDAFSLISVVLLVIALAGREISSTPSRGGGPLTPPPLRVRSIGPPLQLVLLGAPLRR